MNEVVTKVCNHNIDLKLDYNMYLNVKEYLTKSVKKGNQMLDQSTKIMRYVWLRKTLMLTKECSEFTRNSLEIIPMVSILTRFLQG